MEEEVEEEVEGLHSSARCAPSLHRRIVSTSTGRLRSDGATAEMV